MQREGLIGFALLLTLAVLAPQEGQRSEAAADTGMVAPVELELLQHSNERPSMSLTGPAMPSEPCDEHEFEHANGEAGSKVHLDFKVNVSI